jgi:hypothetical protein
MNTFLSAYKELMDEVDESSLKLQVMHQKHLTCKKGCDSCCESLRLFPIELAFINDALKNEGAILPKKRWNKYTKACRFLVNGACSIYEHRPLICRTQGLPLLYEQADGSAFELSVCTLNFKGVDVSKFNTENALFMSPINSKLFLLNQQFVESLKTKKITVFSRYRLNELDSFSF